MNFLESLLHFLPMVGPTVAGIEAIHGAAKDGATKKQLAMASLGLAGDLAASVLPGEASLIQAVQATVGSVIDGTVAQYNATEWPAPTDVLKTGTATAAPSGPTPTPAPAPSVNVAAVPASAPIAKFCAACGNALPDGAKFCPVCGTPVRTGN